MGEVVHISTRTGGKRKLLVQEVARSLQYGPSTRVAVVGGNVLDARRVVREAGNLIGRKVGTYAYRDPDLGEVVSVFGWIADFTEEEMEARSKEAARLIDEMLKGPDGSL